MIVKPIKIKNKSKISPTDLFAYGRTKPLTITCNFNINVCVNKRCGSDDFLYLNKLPRLFMDTRLQYNLLCFETNLNNVTDSVVIKKIYL